MNRERKNIRLKYFDYASEGWYFVTICKDRECFFGEIMHDEMIFSEIGNQVTWRAPTWRLPNMMSCPHSMVCPRGRRIQKSIPLEKQFPDHYQPLLGNLNPHYPGGATKTTTPISDGNPGSMI